jgi:hypothetical protein
MGRVYFPAGDVSRTAKILRNTLKEKNDAKEAKNDAKEAKSDAEKQKKNETLLAGPGNFPKGPSAKSPERKKRRILHPL